jgi:hypothetical protein
MMESAVSGHKKIKIRERLADKLEVIAFDPYSKYSSCVALLLTHTFSWHKLLGSTQKQIRTTWSLFLIYILLPKEVLVQCTIVYQQKKNYWY